MRHAGEDVPNRALVPKALKALRMSEKRDAIRLMSLNLNAKQLNLISCQECELFNPGLEL